MLGNKWSEEEIETLKRLYPSEVTREEIMSVLNRTWNAIAAQAKSLGLHRNKPVPINQANLDKIIRKYKI